MWLRGAFSPSKNLKWNQFCRSLFPEICDKFEENLSHCFSAGNPEKFHVHYTHSMEFLDEFEAKLPFIETLEEFRNSEEYKSFTGEKLADFSYTSKYNGLQQEWLSRVGWTKWAV